MSDEFAVRDQRRPWRRYPLTNVTDAFMAMATESLHGKLVIQSA